MPDRIAMDFNSVAISPEAAEQHKNVIMFPCYDDAKIVNAQGETVFEGSCVMANMHSVVVVTGAEYSELQRLRAERGEGKHDCKCKGPTF